MSLYINNVINYQAAANKQASGVLLEIFRAVHAEVNRVWSLLQFLRESIICGAKMSLYSTNSQSNLA